MPGRTADISTSSFKPLSLDEIMAVPLAKQAQEDKAHLALDEFAKLEANSLEKDKPYVQSQIDSFKKEAGDLSDQLIATGVDRGMINKTRGLRNRKTNELSLQGKTGQASAAYNQYKANEANVMRDPRLTADQKILGLQEAKDNYTGVLEGGQYQDYIGASSVAIQDKAYKIANMMTPEEIKRVTGVELGEDGYYRDKGYVYKDLPAHHIQAVINDALHNDKEVMDYSNELERLGISNTEEELLNASISAGNVFQRKDRDYRGSLLPSDMQKSLDPTKGRFDTSNTWDTIDVTYQDGIWNKDLKVPSEKEVKDLFINGSLVNADPLYNEEREKRISKDRASLVKSFSEADFPPSHKERAVMLSNFDNQNPSYGRENKARIELRESIDKLRKNNSVLAGNKPEVKDAAGNVLEPARPWNDKEIYEIYRNGAKKAEKSMSKVIVVNNPSSTFIKMGENLIGSGTKNGSFVTRNMKIAGMPSGSKEVLAERMGINDLSEFNLMIRETGKVLGFAPGHSEMPGAYVVQVEIKEDTGAYNKGDTPLIYMQSEGKSKELLGSISRMNDAIKEGKGLTNRKIRGAGGKVVNEMTITELNPYSKSYEAAVIRSETEYTKDELDKIEFKRVSSPSGRSMMMGYNPDGSLIVPKVYRLDYDEEMQRSINTVTDYYDSIKDKKTTK